MELKKKKKTHGNKCRMCSKFVKNNAQFCGSGCAKRFYAALKQKKQAGAAKARQDLPAHKRSYFGRINSREERDFWKNKQCCQCGCSGRRMHPKLKRPFWQGGQYTGDNTDYYCDICHTVVYNKE